MIDPSIVIFGQLALAAFLGAVMGTERSVVARQQAGMRTYALVALGSCAFVAAGLFIGGSGAGDTDPARVAAAIVQGVGFIGAGLIFMRGENVHGITTAAGLWVSAAVGVMTAFGMYSVAIFATALTLAIFFILWFVEHEFKRWHGSE